MESHFQLTADFFLVWFDIFLWIELRQNNDCKWCKFIFKAIVHSVKLNVRYIYFTIDINVSPNKLLE